MNAAALLPHQAEEQFPEEGNTISKGLIAFIIAMFEIAYILGAPVIGVTLPKVGRKNYILIGYLIIVVGTVGFAFISLIPSSQRGLWIALAIILRFLQGFGDSCVATSVYSAITIEFPKERELYVGYCQSAVGLGLMLGPVMGTIFNNAFGYEITFLIFAGLMFLCDVVAFFLLPNRLNKMDEQPVEEEVQEVVAEGEKPITFRMFYTNIQCMITSVSAALAMIFMLFFNAILEDHVGATFGEEMGKNAGYLMSLGALTYALCSPFVGTVFKGVPRRYVFFLGFILATVSLLYLGNSHALGYPNSIALLIVGLLLLGVAVSLIFVPLLSEIIETVQEKEGLGENPLLNDKASAVFNAAYATGCVLGPIVGSELFDHFSTFNGSHVVKSGFTHTCDIMALCAACFCVLYFFVNILPHLICKKKKKVVAQPTTVDQEQVPVEVSIENSRSQLRIENVDDSLSGLKKPMLGGDRSIANNPTLAGTMHQSWENSQKLTDDNSIFDPVNSLTETSALMDKKK